MKISRFYLLMIFFIPFTARSQDTLVYNLDEVISIAQEQSPDAQIAKHTYRKEYWTYRSFKAKYLPRLQFDANSFPEINSSYQTDTRLVDSTHSITIYTLQSASTFDASLYLSQKIGFTGGQVFLSSSLNRLENLNTSNPPQYVADIINVGFTQPIFQYNSYKYNKRIMPLEFEKAQRTYVETNEEVAITAVDHFFDLLMAQIEVDIAKKNQSNYDTLYKIAKGRYNLGKIAENELLQLELNLLTAQADVENADLDYQNKLFVFKSYLRLKNDAPVKLIPPVIAKYFLVSAQKAILYAKTNTSTDLDFKKRMLDAENQLYAAKMEGRFDADLTASFGLTRSGNKLPDAYKDPYNGEAVRLGFSIPILDWGEARGNIKLAESNLDLVKTSVEQDRIDFEQDVFLKVTQFNMQENQLRIAAKSDTVAQKRYEVTHKRYMIGKVNDVLELDKAQIDNDNAKLGYYRALMTYWQSYYEVRKMTLFDFEHNRPISASLDELIK